MSELPDAVAERVAKIATGVVSDAAGAVVADIVRDTITQLFWQLFNAVLLGPVLIYIVFYYLPARRNAERLEREARTRVITRKGGQAAEETLAGAIANAGVTQAAAEAKTTRAPDKSNTSPARKDTTKRKSRAKSTKAT